MCKEYVVEESEVKYKKWYNPFKLYSSYQYIVKSSSTGSVKARYNTLRSAEAFADKFNIFHEAENYRIFKNGLGKFFVAQKDMSSYHLLSDENGVGYIVPLGVGATDGFDTIREAEELIKKLKEDQDNRELKRKYTIIPTSKQKQ